jgi:hypothetical protein
MLSKRICFVLLNGREFHGLICFFWSRWTNSFVLLNGQGCPLHGCSENFSIWGLCQCNLKTSASCPHRGISAAVAINVAHEIVINLHFVWHLTTIIKKNKKSKHEIINKIIVKQCFGLNAERVDVEKPMEPHIFISSCPLGLYFPQCPQPSRIIVISR